MKISLLIFFIFIGKSSGKNYSIIKNVCNEYGYQFECFNRSCLPFFTIITKNIRSCQINCLVQIQCQTPTFHQSTYICQLLFYIENENMLTNINTITFIVINQTQIINV